MRDVTKQELEQRYYTDGEFHALVETAVKALEDAYGVVFYGDDGKLARLVASFVLLGSQAEATSPPAPSRPATAK